MKKVFIYFLIGIALFTVWVSLNHKTKKTEVTPDEISKKIEAANQFPKNGYVRNFDISPDGLKLVVEVAKIQGDESSVDLWLMDNDGNNKKRLTSTESDPKTKTANALFKAKAQLKTPVFEQVLAVEPKFLPGGTYIAYYLQTDTLSPLAGGYKSRRQPKIIDLAGNPAFEGLPNNGWRIQPTHPVFSPDMKHYAYAKEIKHDNKEACQIAVDDLETGKETILEQLFSAEGKAPEFIWAPDSNKVAISGKEYSGDKELSNSGPSYLWIYDISSKELKKLAKIGGHEKSVKWSLNSKMLLAWNILYQTNKREDNGTWLFNVSENIHYQIARNNGVYYPVWSLDNKNIALCGGFYDDFQSLGIYIANIDGEMVKQILSGMKVNDFMWTLNDKYIIYSHGFGVPDSNRKGFLRKLLGYELWLASVDGKSNEDLNIRVEHDYDWKYSHSAEQIFYISQIKKRNGDIGKGINWDNLWAFDLKTRQKINITGLQFSNN